jgi:hypothetical protein
MILTKMPEIDAAIAEESWEWLRDVHPDIAAGVESEVKRGTKPDDIRRHVIQKTMGMRPALAVRCGQAAEYLSGNGGG